MSCVHEVTAEQWDALIASIEAGKKHRAEVMPTERDALLVMMEALERLRELGWRDAMHAPRDGRMLEFIEAGSTGIHKGHRDDKFTWIHSEGDLWPSHPILFRETPTDQVRTKVSSEPRNTSEQK